VFLGAIVARASPEVIGVPAGILGEGRGGVHCIARQVPVAA
jgi:agmatine/peptidylarginine deiminase